MRRLARINRPTSFRVEVTEKPVIRKQHNRLRSIQCPGEIEARRQIGAAVMFNVRVV